MPKSRTVAMLAVLAGAALLGPAGREGSEAARTCLPGDLKARLAQISSRFGPVTVVSTYRPGARMPSGQPSFHASCRAVDFRPAAGTYGAVASWLKSNHGGGVGTYGCGVNHIHIDNGPHIRFHYCGRAGGSERGWPRLAARRSGTGAYAEQSMAADR
jgi:uncharacterized protein YcbK (DUF882 family)